MTGILVLLPNSEDNMLTWPGCWCVMTMKAMPESGGMWPKNSCRASKPPAEEPMPTIGKRRIPGRPSSVSSGAGGSPSGENVKEGSSAFRGAIFSALLRSLRDGAGLEFCLRSFRFAAMSNPPNRRCETPIGSGIRRKGDSLRPIRAPKGLARTPRQHAHYMPKGPLSIRGRRAIRVSLNGFRYACFVRNGNCFNRIEVGRWIDEG